MYISSENLLTILIVGVIAGWLAGVLVRGAGFGLIGDLLVGIIGAFTGDWLLPRLDIFLGTGLVAAIIDALIGAVVLLLLIRLFSGGWGGGWRGHWGGWGWRRPFGRRW